MFQGTSGGSKGVSGDCGNVSWVIHGLSGSEFQGGSAGFQRIAGVSQEPGHRVSGVEHSVEFLGSFLDGQWYFRGLHNRSTLFHYRFITGGLMGVSADLSGFQRCSRGLQKCHGRLRAFQEFQEQSLKGL